jgi:cytochrome c1
MQPTNDNNNNDDNNNDNNNDDNNKDNANNNTNTNTNNGATTMLNKTSLHVSGNLSQANSSVHRIFVKPKEEERIGHAGHPPRSRVFGVPARNMSTVHATRPTHVAAEAGQFHVTGILLSNNHSWQHVHGMTRMKSNCLECHGQQFDNKNAMNYAIHTGTQWPSAWKPNVKYGVVVGAGGRRSRKTLRGRGSRLAVC